MPPSRPDRLAQRPGLLPALTAVVFSVVCWLVFSRLFDTRDVDALPELTRRFLFVQPWWLGAGLLGLIIAWLGQAGDHQPLWKRAAQAYSMALAVFSVINIGWGIVAMYLLILIPVDL